MRPNTEWIIMSWLALCLFWPVSNAVSQDRYTASGRDRWEDPLELKDMGPYKDIQFEPANFQKVGDGMTEEDVLTLLGKPLDLTKEHRKRDRWTVHYHYPKGRVVNFKDGLVVGKEGP